MARHSSSFFQGWEDKEHVRIFDWFSYFPTPLFIKQFEYFNEIRLLQKYFEKEGSSDKSMFEVGCATGEMVRYLKKKGYNCDYYGFDISEQAITAAKKKFPLGKFKTITENSRDIVESTGKADLVFSRDVIMHQTDPWGFLDSLLELAAHTVILRMKTRDKGDTCLDPELSCQAHYDKYWMPYIIINVDELCAHLSKKENVAEINIIRSYGVLGGKNGRFLPKELYFSESGTAETAIQIRMGNKTNSSPTINLIDRSDKLQLSLIERAWLKLWLIYKRPEPEA